MSNIASKSNEGVCVEMIELQKLSSGISESFEHMH